MGASELRDLTLQRQRELAARHEVLAGLGADPQHSADQLAGVLDATNDLIMVLDRIDARAARRRLLAAIVLLGLAPVPAVLVAAGVLGAYWLITALGLLVAAAALWLATRPGGDREAGA